MVVVIDSGGEAVLAVATAETGGGLAVDVATAKTGEDSSLIEP